MLARRRDCIVVRILEEHRGNGGKLTTVIVTQSIQESKKERSAKLTDRGTSVYLPPGRSGPPHLVQPDHS